MSLRALDTARDYTILCSREQVRAMKSLKKYKASPEYRAQLRETIRTASLEARDSETDIQRRRARLTLLEVEAELSSLENGTDPDVFSGFVRFPEPEREFVI